MSVLVKNTANDRMKAHLHRTATKFTYEPSIGGVRLRLGETMEITFDQYEAMKDTLATWEAKGMVEVTLPESTPDEQPKDELPPAPPADTNTEPPAEASTADTQIMDGSPTTIEPSSTEGAPRKGSKKKLF